MSKKLKLLQRLQSKPTDFSWRELVRLLNSFGFEYIPAGKTGGSRIKFIHTEYPVISMHKPHPSPILKRYQIDFICEYLLREGLICQI